MQFFGAYLAALALSATVGAGTVRSCPSGLHMIVTSGHGGKPHAYGKLGGLVNDIRGAIPGTTNYSIPYPKGDMNDPEAVAAGVQLLTDNIAHFAARCPDTPVVTIGYSEGAIVMSNTLCGRSHAGAPPGPPLDPKYVPTIIASIGYGDETFTSGQSFNWGTCTNGEGVDPRQNSTPCAPYAPNWRSYCDKPDPLCCGGTQLFTHYRYPKKYNYKVTQYIVSQYETYVNGKKRRSLE